MVEVHVWYGNFFMTATSCKFVYTARLKFEKGHFKIQENPLILTLEEKLQAAQTSNVKLLLDFLRTEEYRE